MMSDEWRGWRGRRDRRKWCQGRAGVKHVPGGIGKGSYYGYWSRDGARACRWLDDWYRGKIVGRAYRCAHQEVCQRCGKVLLEGLGRSCPDWYQERPA